MSFIYAPLYKRALICFSKNLYICIKQAVGKLLGEKFVIIFEILHEYLMPRLLSLSRWKF